jgi:hypothetical protein
MSSLSPAFKDTKKKTSVYTILRIRVSQRDRWISLGFELPIPGNGARKRGLLMGKTVLKFTASLRVTWCLFHQGGFSLDLSIQGSEENH